MSCPVFSRTFQCPAGYYLKIILIIIGISNLEKVYVHRKIEFVNVNQNSLTYGGGKIVFHRSVVKACFVFRNPHCPILKTALHRFQLRIMPCPAGIRLRSVLSGCPAGRKFSCSVHLYSCLMKMFACRCKWGHQWEFSDCRGRRRQWCDCRVPQ